MSNENKKRNGKLLVTVCFITVVTIIFLTLAQIFSIRAIVRREINRDSSVQYDTICKTSSTLCATLIDEYLSKLNYYTNADVVLDGGSTEEIVEWLCSDRVKELRPGVFDYIGFVDMSGNNYADSGATSSVSDRDYYKAIAGGEDRFIDNPTIARSTGKKIIHVCKVVKQNGNRIGFFYGAVNPDVISDMLDSLINLGEAGYAVAFGGDGSIVGTSTDDDVFMNALESTKSNNPESYSKIEQSWLAQDKYDEEVTFNGSKTLLVGSHVNKTEWNLVLFLKESVVFKTATVVSTSLMIGGVILCIIIILVIIAILFVSIKPLSVVENTIRGIATGDADLTKRIDLHSNNEIGRVVEGFNLFSEKLQTIIATMKSSKEELVNVGELLQNSSEDTSSAIIQIIGNIESMGNQVSLQSDSVHETAGAVNQIASNIESLNRMIESQSSAVEEASAAVEEMIGNINSVNNSVQKMANSFEDLEGKAVKGVQKQNDVNAKIEEIQIESQALREANTVIKGIAEQTNLLAMNAAIEAAHAGEAGKGFSVVADEIRKLSEDSGTQSQTIGDQLDKIIGSIEQIVDASMTASEAFNEVATGINSTTNLVREITNAMTEQNEGSKQIAIALNSMNDTSNEVKTASIEMAEGNKAILDEIKTLQDSSYNIKCGMDEMSNGARKINETGAALSDLTNKMKESITNIGTQVDQFKV